MKKSIAILFILFSISTFFAQTNNRWSDLFSYNNVLAFKENNGKIIAATENGVFYYNTSTGEITKLSKANGLHEVKISAFDYDAASNTAIVGYNSGNLDVITNTGVTYVVDIPLSQSFTGSKAINNISINGNRAVVSVNYGVSIFNIIKKEFGDTCFFFNGATYEKVLEATIKDDKVYAATGNALKYHAIDVTFPVYSNWSSVAGNYTQIDSKDKLVLSTQNAVYYGDINSFLQIPQSFSNVKDVRITGSDIVVADQDKVYQFDLSGVLKKSISIEEEVNTAFIVNNSLFTGTKHSGIYDESKTSYKPDGPYSNISYKISLLENQLWVSTGGRDSYNTPTYNNLGYYHFDGTKWIYPDYFKTSTNTWNILDVTPNPSNTSEVFFTNYSFYVGQKGFYKMNNNDFVKAYAQNDSNSLYNRTSGCAFDENNQLFCSLSLIANNTLTEGVYVYNNSTDEFVLHPLITAGGMQKPLIKNNTLFIPSPYYNSGGLIISDYKNTPLNFSDDKTIMITKNNGLEASGTVCVAIDKNDDIWLGTRLGLRVLPNASNAINNTKNNAEPIIITQNGIPEELFKDLIILQIDVDSGNQKWVSTEGGGVFYLSSNGETTIEHFTKVNSPLPNDTVTDIKVDQVTGKVYFVTYDGIVVYQGDVINVSENFADVKVYPNPVITSQFKGNVKITGLAEKTNIRITDAAGNVVHQAVARGGYYEWNLNNQRGIRVASGVYFVLMTNEDGTDTATAKIAVVN